LEKAEEAVLNGLLKVLRRWGAKKEGEWEKSLSDYGYMMDALALEKNEEKAVDQDLVQPVELLLGRKKSRTI